MGELDEVGRLRAYVADLQSSLNAHLAGFSKAEWQTLKGYLRRMLDNAESCRGARCAVETRAPAAEATTR